MQSVYIYYFSAGEHEHKIDCLAGEPAKAHSLVNNKSSKLIDQASILLTKHDTEAK